MKRKEATPLSLPQDSAGTILYLVHDSCTPVFPYFKDHVKVWLLSVITYDVPPISLCIPVRSWCSILRKHLLSNEIRGSRA